MHAESERDGVSDRPAMLKALSDAEYAIHECEGKVGNPSTLDIEPVAM